MGHSTRAAGVPRGSGRKPAQACLQEGQASWKVTSSRELGSASLLVLRRTLTGVPKTPPQLQARPDSRQAGNGFEWKYLGAEEHTRPANSWQRPETHPKTARAETAGERASHDASLTFWPLSFLPSILPSGRVRVPGRDSCPQQRIPRNKAFSQGQPSTVNR